MTISDAALARLRRGFGEPDFTGTRYELVSTLGRGGMGVVYLAHDTVLDREVALKVVDAGPQHPENDAVQAVKREAAILARLEHPGIVPVHDFGQLSDGRLFYAMKRVRGEGLDRWAAGADLHARLGVFLRICEAVAFAHARGVIHRDLKPANVMVGQFGEVLVLDWGVAHASAAPEGSGPTVVGTPEYMAPEQARAETAVDERADVYSLGVMLSALAQGPRPIDAIVTKARSIEPAGRYQTVQALSADVSRFLSGLAVEAHHESIGDRLARLWRRYRLPIALILAYVVMRALLLWLS
jgi:serine/threonine protein kinase